MYVIFLAPYQNQTIIYIKTDNFSFYKPLIVYQYTGILILKTTPRKHSKGFIHITGERKDRKMIKGFITLLMLFAGAAVFACSGCGCFAPASKKQEVKKAAAKPAEAKAKKAVMKVAYIDKSKLQELIKANDNLAIVDVLSSESFGKAHIKGAMNIPLGKLREDKKLIESLKNYKTVVVYCASKKCMASTKAAKLLMESGLKNVLSYKNGLAEWKDSKLLLEPKKSE